MKGVLVREKLVLVLALLVGLEFAQWAYCRPNSVGVETVSSPGGGGVANSTAILLSRQDEGDEDDDESGGVDEDTQKRISQGVGNILLGAFSLDPNRIIQGAFGFADKDVRENILNVILGQKPPGAGKDTPTKLSASTTEAAPTLAQSSKGKVNRNPPPANPNRNTPNDPPQTKSQENTRKIITTTTTQPTTTTTRKVRKTTVYVPEDDEEADLRY